jgi:uncharacterized membrane protein
VVRGALMDGSTVILGIEIPSTNPVFLAIIGIHIPLGLACVIVGAVAMLNPKGRGRHSKAGLIYYWCLGALFVTATLLAVMRWTENSHLFVIGALAFISAWLGRNAVRKRWLYWTRMHITGMGLSYTLMLVAFYVDNGPQLPLWKDLPDFTYWLLPLAVGLPLIIRALTGHPLRRLGDPT